MNQNDLRQMHINPNNTTETNVETMDSNEKLFFDNETIRLTEREVSQSYQFAQSMVGKHNPDIIMPRNNIEIFRDDFRGKMGEIALKRYLNVKMPNIKITKNIDMGIYGRGIWDSGDLVVNGLHLDVKSVRSNSDFLMIETKRFNDNGMYNYNNNDGSSTKVDMFVLVRVTIIPEIKYEEQMKYTNIIQHKNQYKIFAKVLGAISHTDFMKKKHFAKRGIECNKNTLMKICEGQYVPICSSHEYKNKTQILQQDNFILYKDELFPIEYVIKELCTN